MMKSEFISRLTALGASITEEELSKEDYDVIQFVYMYHPSISDSNGKEDIARIWMLPGGMRIIRDMVSTATKVKEIEEEECKIRYQIKQLQSQLDELQTKKKDL